jgi:hypothetical protein
VQHERSVSQQLLQQFVQTSYVQAEQQHAASATASLSGKKARLEPSVSITVAKNDNILLRICLSPIFSELVVLFVLQTPCRLH